MADLQRAGIAALSREGDEAVDRMRHVYDKRRKLMVELMRRVRFGIPVMPQGAFYDASKWTDDILGVRLRTAGEGRRRRCAGRGLRGEWPAMEPERNAGPRKKTFWRVVLVLLGCFLFCVLLPGTGLFFILRDEPPTDIGDLALVRREVAIEENGLGADSLKSQRLFS